jgi:hypothetical protein
MALKASVRRSGPCRSLNEIQAALNWALAVSRSTAETAGDIVEVPARQSEDDRGVFFETGVVANTGR